MRVAPDLTACSAVSMPAVEWPIEKTMLRRLHSLMTDIMPASSGAPVMIRMEEGMEGFEGARCSAP